MVRQLILCSMALLVSATTCYTPSYLRARAPVAAPLDTACLKRELAAYTRREAKPAKRHSTPDEVRQVAFGVDSGSTNIAQVIRRDSSVFLESEEANDQQIFTGEQGDSVFDAFATLLLGARDSCGGVAPSSGRVLVVVSNNPPHEGWLLGGTNARVSVKRVSDTYRVMVDTIGKRADGSPKTPSWVQVDRSELRRIPKGHTLVTECSRQGSPFDGGVIAVARTTRKKVYTDILHAWRLDSVTLRFRPDSNGMLACRTPVEGAA